MNLSYRITFFVLFFVQFIYNIMPCMSFFYEKVVKWWGIKEDGQMTNAGILFADQKKINLRISISAFIIS